MPRTKTPPKPVRVSLWDAAAMAGLHTRTMQREVSRGLFTAIRPAGVGRGKRCYLLTAELDLYIAGRLDELADLKAKNSRRH